jgi:uncharacterized membrane protein YphA (DoxX/SURF4 family)
MKKTILLIRIFVGVLFIFSGLIKANDPLGLSYKMQEFFELWHMTYFNDYTLMLSILMIAFEIIAGVAVILGWQFNLFSWLLFMLIIFFTFLTGYAVITGSVKECGCFGDCIKLTAGESFTKDIVLFILIAFLLAKRNSVRSILKTTQSVILLSTTVIFSFLFQYYVLIYLPLVDCLPYKVGLTIQEEMKIPKDAITDSTVIKFVYTYKGKEVEFDAENFPADFNDTSYVFVRRYDKLIREGNAQPKIKDFVIINKNEKDTTNEVLNADGRIYLIISKSINPSNSTDKILSQIQLLESKAKKEQIPVLAISADPDGLTKLFNEKKIGLEVCKGDLVAIKTAARTTPTVYLLEKGKILNKWGVGNLDKVSE